jgi:hypothetical protein
MTETENLWGAKAISRESGLSTDVIYQLAGHRDVPIYRPPGTGRLYANRSELNGWLRTKPKLPKES